MLPLLDVRCGKNGKVEEKDEERGRRKKREEYVQKTIITKHCEREGK